MKDEMIMLIEFKEGMLPFKYLEVPITYKKLSVEHYSELIEKILSRISHLPAKLLTYAGRLQLIKSVSFDVANYWMSCFPLPKAVIRKIESMCRSFLWTCKDTISRKILVAGRLCSSL